MSSHEIVGIDVAAKTGGDRRARGAGRGVREHLGRP
jgi:hypothetical protein